MAFSRRFGYDPKQPTSPVLEDAPEWLRVDYLNLILQRITFVDGDPRYSNEGGRPIGIKAIHSAFCALLRAETDSKYSDSWYCWDELVSHLKACAWYHFYDFVELAGRQLSKEQDQHSFNEHWIAEYGYGRYRDAVNELFAEHKVGWRLDDSSQLVRRVPEVLAKYVERTDTALQDRYEPARAHYRKARRYLFEHSLDPENSIKEIVSALESVARTHFDGASTLRDAIKEMRRQGVTSPLLLSVFEKFYAYASAEPAVRHGSSKSSQVERVEAELCLFVGLAMIRYLIDRMAADQKQGA